jgi:DNA polymerase-3 subunit gamma/tau
VLSLVVRAGGGSVRDTLSLLDQLIAGSEGSTIQYERAVSLLGYTHAALLDEAVDALGAMDAGAAFSAVDRVIQTGQDPRRFVEDLLERLRDLIVVAATRDGAAAVLRGIPNDELERMSQQALAFGAAELSRAADVVNSSLTEMTGATSPRLHLELMIARLLVPAADDTTRGALARVERLERRIGIDDVPPVVSQEKSPRLQRTAPESGVPKVKAPEEAVESAPSVEPAAPSSAAPLVAATPTLAQLRDAWPEILEIVQKAKRTAWMVVYTSTPRALSDDVLTLSFPSETDVTNFKERPTSGDSVSEQLRSAIAAVLGIRVKFVARVDAAAAQPAVVEAVETEAVPTPAQEPAAAGWNVTPIPGSDAAAVETAEVEEATTRDPTAGTAVGAGAAGEVRNDLAPQAKSARARYGEAVVRELLGANFLEEQDLTPRDRPVTLEPSSESSQNPGE